MTDNTTAASIAAGLSESEREALQDCSWNRRVYIDERDTTLTMYDKLFLKGLLQKTSGNMHGENDIYYSILPLGRDVLAVLAALQPPTATDGEAAGDVVEPPMHEWEARGREHEKAFQIIRDHIDTTQSIASVVHAINYLQKELSNLLSTDMVRDETYGDIWDVVRPDLEAWDYPSQITRYVRYQSEELAASRQREAELVAAACEAEKLRQVWLEKSKVEAIAYEALQALENSWDGRTKEYKHHKAVSFESNKALWAFQTAIKNIGESIWKDYLKEQREALAKAAALKAAEGAE